MGHQRRARRPSLEQVEGRQLLSGLLLALQAHPARPDLDQLVELGSARTAATTAAQAAATSTLAAQSVSPATTAAMLAPTGTNPTAAGVYTGNGAINSGDGSASGPNAATQFPVAPLLGNGTPTQAELAREKFVAHFQGPMTTLPPRFSDQSKILYLRGLGGSTPNFFLHGDYALAMVFPAGFNPQDPAASAPVTGFAFLDDKNNNSGGTVGLDLTADATSFDGKGRPTRLFFTSDPNIYSGIFYANQSSGTVTVKYGPGNTATATFNGRIYTSGLTSPFQNTDLYAQHSG